MLPHIRGLNVEDCIIANIEIGHIMILICIWRLKAAHVRLPSCCKRVSCGVCSRHWPVEVIVRLAWEVLDDLWILLVGTRGTKGLRSNATFFSFHQALPIDDKRSSKKQIEEAPILWSSVSSVWVIEFYSGP